ncbi:MAG: BACON domain-containing protein, partial [Anaerolineales bacterium]|nr:BACON domain-containing protein [Anaerolineales bacterium]
GTIAPERRITVRNSPNRLDTDQSFLFRLPFWAISGGSLQVRARLNPGGFPLEPVNGASDNTMLSPNYPVYTSPRLGLLLAEFTYTLNGVTYRPQGTLANATWISRAYPLGYRLVGGEYEPGLEWNSVAVEDSQLGARVGRMLPQCEAYVVRDDKNNITEDNREFCASDYVNGRLARVRYLFGAPSSTFIYGEIPDSGLANFFPRGQAHEGRISSGPDAVVWNGYYAGHEVGHTAALGHPEQSIVAGCIDRFYELDKDGNPDFSKPIRGDAKPTYPKAHIGPDNNSVNGLTYANFSGRWRWEVLPGSQWDDMMGYCNQPNWPHQWISDQNYERIYSFLAPALADADADVQQVPQAGDYLALFGSIAPAGNQAAIALFERWSEVMAMPDITAGEFVLRQFDQNDQLLSGVSFAAADGTEGWRPFELVVPAEAGVARVAIVRASDNLIIAEQSISANVPTLSVPTAVLDGDEIQIAWQGSDADGDTLAYDVYASRDGAMFEPLQFGLSGTSTTITAAEIGGGSVVFRVIANDGVQTAAQDSAPLELSAQPPQIRSFDPACGFQINWGQAANLSADVWDLQDGLLPSSSLHWQLNGADNGTGYWQSYISALPICLNTATLSVTNSAGLTTTADCTFFVDDDLSVPAAELSVTPATVNWNFNSEDPALQTADLALANLGGGTLTWTASENASWLTIDKGTGELPDTLQLTADPTALPSQSLYNTMLTISAFDEEGQLYQTIELPITLWVDQGGYTPPLNTSSGNKALYLPFIRQP